MPATSSSTVPLAESVHWSPHQNRVWKPVICAVNGLCVGGGLHFVVDADIVIASRNARFMDTHVNVGPGGSAREHRPRQALCRWAPRCA